MYVVILRDPLRIRDLCHLSCLSFRPWPMEHLDDNDNDNDKILVRVRGACALCQQSALGSCSIQCS